MKYDSTYTMRSKDVPAQKYKGANVKESRLNSGGDQKWRGSRGKMAKSYKKGKMAY